MGYIKYYILLIDIVFELNVVSKHYSGILKICKNYLIFEFMSFSSLYKILHSKYIRESIYSFQYSILPITILLLIETCPLYAIEIFIFQTNL
jgi:hypothetical protein